MKTKNIFKNMRDDIIKSRLDEVTKKKLFENLLNLENQKINLMITGATGCGKSSTINALFNTEVAKVGVGVDPETMEIQKYELENLILWDSPGLGDGKEKDIQHAKDIVKKLNELDENGKPLIDLVLVILDGGSRDLGTSYELINQVIIPNIGENKQNRILIAINQADTAMRGRYWDYENNKPESKLVTFLEEKAKSVKERVKEATGVDIDPIYYAAGYKEENEEQRPWNLSKLLSFIVKYTPTEKRLSYADNLSDKKEMWEDDDGLKDYTQEVQKSMVETIVEYASKGADIGRKIGSVFGKTGEAFGSMLGGAFGFAVGLFRSWF